MKNKVTIEEVKKKETFTEEFSKWMFRAKRIIK